MLLDNHHAHNELIMCNSYKVVYIILGGYPYIIHDSYTVQIIDICMVYSSVRINI